MIDEDNTDHSEYYDVIRSNNVDQLEALIQSANSGSTILYDSLSKDYESLKLKNVYIHETMQIFVEERLARELFLREIMNANDTSKPKTNADTSRPEFHIYQRLNLIINAANELNKTVSSPYIENPKGSIALLIARHIRAVKEDLKSTYDQLPWEEMEFYLSRYSFLPNFEKEKLLHHLTKFLDKLKSVFGIQDEFGKNESDVQEKINGYVKKKAPFHRGKVDGFEAFYTDYELLKDEYSLTKMLRYTKLAIEVDPEEQSGRLIVQRALQVVGEYVKNSLASPHLSQRTQEIFIRNMMSVTIEIVPLLRNIMAHTDTLHAIFLRNSIESEQGFFTKVQGDLKGVMGVIVSVLRSIKTKRFIVWCENIICENDVDVFDELCAGFLEYLQESELPEYNEPLIDALDKVDNLFADMRKIIAGYVDESTVNKIEAAIAKFESIIVLDKKLISDGIMKFDSFCQSIKEEIHGQLDKSRLNKRSNNNLDNITALKRRKKFFKKFPFLAFDGQVDNRGSERLRNYSLIVLWTHEIENNLSHQKILEYPSDIRRILRPVIQMSKSIEEYKEKFDIFETAPAGQNDNTEKELEDDFKAFKDVLGNAKEFLNFQTALERKRGIHNIKLKIGGCYKDNKQLLKSQEIAILDEELIARRSKGKEFLTADCYEEFLMGKREIGKFAGALCLKSNKERFIEIFNEIKLQHGAYAPKSVLDETIQQMKSKLTPDQYENLIKKMTSIEKEHEAKLKLSSFFDFDIELEKEVYDQLVASLNVKSTTKFQDLYKVIKNISAVVESFDNAYGVLIDVLKNKESSVVKICNSYGNFLKSLQLDPRTTELLKRTILDKKIFTILEKRFTSQLNLLKKVLGNIETRESKYALISRYRSDTKLRAVVEMLLFDLCNLSMIVDPLWIKFIFTTNTISMKFLEKGFVYLNGSVSFLTGNSPLRNYLAHGDALIDALPFDSSIAVISCAILFCEEGESLLALRILVSNGDKMAKNLISSIPDQELPENLLSDLNFNVESLRTFQSSNSWKYFQSTKLKNPIVENDVYRCYELSLNQCVSQVSLFMAASQGDKEKLESLFESGEEIYSRESRMRSLLHVAANEGHNDIAKVLLDNGIDVDAIDKDKNTSMHLATRKGHCLVVETLLRYKAKVDALNASECTSLHGAVPLDLVNNTDILLNCVADFNDKFTTPLHKATSLSRSSDIKLLDEDKADINVDDNKADINVEDNKADFNVEDNKAYINVEDKADINVEDKADINIEDKADISIEDKADIRVDYKADINVEDKADINVEDRADINVEDKADINVEDKADINVEDKAEINVEDNADINIEDKADINVEDSADINVEDKADINVEDNAGNKLIHMTTKEVHNNAEVSEYLRSIDSDLVNSEKKFQSIQLFSSAMDANDNNAEAVRTRELSKIDELLWEAVSDGKLEIVKMLLENGANVNLTVGGGSLLLLASCFGHNNIVKFLITHDELTENMKNNVLHGAILFGNYDTVEILVETRKIDVNTPNETGATPLQLAVTFNHLSIVKYLMEQGVTFDGNTSVYRIFQTAVSLSYLDLVKYLIEKMSDNIDEIFNYVDDVYGDNLLHMAAGLGFTDIVNILLETKKDETFVNGYDKYQQTPLCCAASIGHTSIVKTLLKNGADVNAKHNHITSPLELSAMFGFEKITKILLGNGANVNVKRSTGKTPLIHAAAFDEVNILQILLENDADVNATDYTSRTALHYTSIRGNKTSIAILLAFGADPNRVDNLGQTPFSYAVSQGIHEIVQLLLSNGAKTNLADEDESMELQFATI